MKHFFIMIVVASSLATLCGCKPTGTDQCADGVNTGSVDLVIPEAVTRLEPDGNWDADTLCVADGRVYFYAYIEDMPRSVIYVGDTVLLEAPTLGLFWSEDDSSHVKVSTVGRSVMVDFGDPASRTQLSLLSEHPSGYERYSRHQTGDLDGLVLYCHEVDYPGPTVEHRQEIARWLTRLMLACGGDEMQVAFGSNTTYARHNYGMPTAYKGQPGDSVALFDFLARDYFESVREDYGNNPEDYPAELYSNLSLRVAHSTPRFVTYQLYISDYYGGAHGLYSERLITYDPIHRQEVDWNYLFKPQACQEVMELVEEAAQRDEACVYWDVVIDGGVPVYDNRGNITDKCTLPSLGLDRRGVVFSFQPYEVACFAAGATHLTIPYSALMPYFTERGRALIGC